MVSQFISCFLVLLTSFLAWSQFVPFSFWNSVHHLAFISPPLTFLTKTCSAGLTIQTQLGGIPRAVVGDLAINLSDPGGITYYSDPYCSQMITQPTIPNGTSQVTFYLISQSLGTINIKATAPLYLENNRDNQNHTFVDTPFLWTGGADPDSSWSASLNWSGGLAPGISDIAIFDGTCSLNCSPNLDSNIDVGGIRLETGFTGTINQNSYEVDIRSGDFVQLAGTFIGDSSGTAKFELSQDGGLILVSGTMTYPALETRINGKYYVSPTMILNIPTDSYFYFWCSGAADTCHQTTQTLEPGLAAYENVYIKGARTSFNLAGSLWNIQKNLTLGSQYERVSANNGTIELYGNLSSYYQGAEGSAIIKIMGNPLGQTIFGDSNDDDFFPRLHIEAGSHSVTLSGQILTGDYRFISAGSLVTTGSTLTLDCTGGGDCYNKTPSWDLGSPTYNNIKLYGDRSTINLGGATWIVSGDLSIGDKQSIYNINNGRIQVAGNLLARSQGNTGTVIIELIGNSLGQTINQNGASNARFPTIEMNSGSNPITIVGNIQPMNWIYNGTGTFTATGSTVTLNCPGSPCSGTTMNPTFGSVNYNNLTISGNNNDWELSGETVIVNGLFRFGDITGPTSGSEKRLIGGTVEAYGDILEINKGYRGSTLINVKGNILGQIVTGLGGYFPALQIDAGSNNVTFIGVIDVIDYTYLSSGTFITTGSQLKFTAKVGWPQDGITISTIQFGPVTYGSVFFNGYLNNFDLSGQVVLISEDLILSSQGGQRAINNGTLRVSGNLIVVNNSNDHGYRGNALIELVGKPSGQSITSLYNARSPVIEIKSGAHTVSLTGSLRPDGWIYTSGTFNGLSGSVLEFNVDTAHPFSNSSVSLNLGSSNFHNLTISGRNTDFDLNGANITVQNQLTFGDLTTPNKSLNNVNFLLRGNLISSSQGNIGNATLLFQGSNNQTLSGTGTTFPNGNITINKAGGLITLARNVSFQGAGQNLLLQQGSINMAGFNLNIGNELNLQTGTVITQNGGSLTYGSLVNNGTIN